MFKNKYLKFGISGGFFTSLDFVIYVLLSNVIPINPSKAISITFSTICAFFANKNWVFMSLNLNKWSVVLRFSIVFFINLLINVITNGMVFEFTGKKIFSFVVATIVASVVNFTLQSRWVFR